MVTVDKTPYQILGTPENTDYIRLRKVYRTKIHEHLQKKISSIDFRHICRAYEAVSDFDKRQRYDSHKEWISEVPLNRYTSQQLAAEPDLIRELKKRLEKVSLTEINAKDPITGHTTLYCAARAGNIEAVKFLTEHGAEPDLSQRTQSTALHVASFYGHANVVRCLLENGADYRIVNQMNSTAEIEAFDDNVKNVFTELKQNDYVRIAANELDWFQNNGLKQHRDAEFFSQRQTLLHCASKKVYFDMARWLVEERSANINLTDSRENSALHLAAYGGHTDIVEYLLNRGCDSTLTNLWGTTAEEEGARHGIVMNDLFQNMRKRDMFEMARKGKDWWFYYYFSDHRSKDMIDSEGISLLYYACRYGHYSVTKWLLEHGANIDIQMGVAPRSTPSHGAKFHGHLSVLKLLLDRGADLNIKNTYNVNVFEEAISATVDYNISNQIKELLLQHQHNMATEKVFEIKIFEDDDDGNDPIIAIKLGLEAKKDDLMKLLPRDLKNKYPYFSVARSKVDFKTDTNIISSICYARYTSSRFVEMPISLICHKTIPKSFRNQQPVLDNTSFNEQIIKKGTVNKFSLKPISSNEQCITIKNLKFTFSQRSITNKIDFEVITLFSPDFNTFGLRECICLFKIDCGRDNIKLAERPTVSITDDPQARLYTLAMPARYWISSEYRQAPLPMFSGIHAFVHHANIVPGILALPTDMFIPTAVGQPLSIRKNPVPCKYLTIREHNKAVFPHIAYHGTNINVIRSILLDGLVIPGTVVTSGTRVTPPKNHFGRDETHFDIPDFADAIFVSPSIHYSSHPVYARPFSDGDQQLIPVLECSVKRNKYRTFRNTVQAYTEHPGEDINTIDWRITDPADVEINAVLFITTVDSIAQSRADRLESSIVTTSSSSCTIS